MILNYKIHAKGFVEYTKSIPLYDGEGNQVSEHRSGGMIYPGDNTKLEEVFDEATATHIKNNVWTEQVLDAYQQALAAASENV